MIRQVALLGSRTGTAGVFRPTSSRPSRQSAAGAAGGGNLPRPVPWRPPGSRGLCGSAAAAGRAPLASQPDLAVLKRWLRHWTRVRHREAADAPCSRRLPLELRLRPWRSSGRAVRTDRVYADGGHLLDFINKACECWTLASAPLGVESARHRGRPDVLAELGEIAANKPANPDMYSTAYAEFVETFVRVLGDPALPHLFFIEGGALAVENALKVAFDWKSRKNEAAGRDRNLGTQIMHLTHAFHGRSGYTLSLTNTEPHKTDRFPKFNWPRIDVPAITHPLAGHLGEVIIAEAHALGQAEQAFAEHPHDCGLHCRAHPGRGR